MVEEKQMCQDGFLQILTLSLPVLSEQSGELDQMRVFCPAGITKDHTGQYEWPDTTTGQEARLPCSGDGGVINSASRQCSYSETSASGVWSTPVTNACRALSGFTQSLQGIATASHQCIESVSGEFWLTFCALARKEPEDEIPDLACQKWRLLTGFQTTRERILCSKCTGN